MPPEAFEDLMGQMLAAVAVRNPAVSKRLANGNMTGVGEYVLPLVTIPVQFEFRRTPRSIRPIAVRRLREAADLAGCEALLVTTEHFSMDACSSASRGPGRHVRLIDGDELCDLLRAHSVGVATKERVVEEVILDPEYFTDEMPASNPGTR